MTKLKIIASIAFLLVLGASAWSTIQWMKSDRPAPREPIDMGIVYVPITSQNAAVYGTGIDHGALVTEVKPGTPAYGTGLQAGDVIIGFNGIPIHEGVSLATLLMNCSRGHGDSPHDVTIEAWVDGCIHVLHLTHAGGMLY